ncbi:VOC family protein [Priestia endophytica]|uniref:VOC family protein n=1 Tax=Priestia endophytica TaxID=135735 RepID=UPI00227FB4B6|nr:VOC family protein [Priestia endophytica]MCY8231631.1 VOC family protein [Priestia endophytica]
MIKALPILKNNKINQIAFVVQDIEQASEAFAKLLGIKKPEWFLTGTSDISKVVFRGKPTSSRSKLVFINTEGVQIELIEPDHEPGTMREFLNTVGEGIHHIAFDVESLNEGLQNMNNHDLLVLQTGEFTSSYAYVDSIQQYKTLIELLERDEPHHISQPETDCPSLLGTTKIEQLAFVVKDLDAAAEAYCKLLGVEKPEVIESGSCEIFQVEFEGKPTEADSKYTFINTPMLQIELIEPGNAPSTWKKHLEKHGEGVHHISFVVKNLDKKIQVLQEMGYPVIQRGNFYNGKGRYAYFDTVSDYKVIIELLERYES